MSQRGDTLVDDLHPDHTIGYKFTDDPSFLARGSVLLGNWHHYARIEGHRRDAFDSAGCMPFAENGSVVIDDGMGQSISFSGGQIVARPTRGAMMFCMSWNSHNDIGRKSAAGFSVDIRGLVVALRDNTSKILGPAACEKVVYSQRASTGDGFIAGHPYFKDPSFAAEEELRMVFNDNRFDGWNACAPATPDTIVVELGPRPDIFTRLF